MKTKPGVFLHNLKMEMRKVLIAADSIWKDHDRELVVTDTDGTIWNEDTRQWECFVHSPGSLHPFGYAVDLRSDYFGRGEAEVVAQALRDQLGEGYDVIVHSTHIHVEYDRAKYGKSYS